MMKVILALAALSGLVSAQSGSALILNYCNAGSAQWQQWTLTPNGTNLFLTSTAKSQPMCMDVEAYDGLPGATVWTYRCADGSRTNEFFDISANSIKSLINTTNPTCLAVASGNGIFNGTVVTTALCSAADSNQDLVFSAATGLIVHTPSGLCVDAGSAVPPQDFCTIGNHSSWTICDPTAAIDDRTADIVSRISLADKILALGTATPFLQSIGAGPYNWWSEATHGESSIVKIH